VKKIYGLFTIGALLTLSAPLPAAAQASGTPLDLTNTQSRDVMLEVGLPQLGPDGQRTAAGFGPMLRGQLTVSGGVATVSVAGADSGIQAPLFDPLRAGPANITLTDGSLMNPSALTVEIELSSGDAEIRQMSMGTINVTASIGNNAVLSNQPLEFVVTTRSATGFGSLFRATLMAAAPMGGAPVTIMGSACARSGSPFLDDMSFSVRECDGMIMAGGASIDEFVSEVEFQPAGFDPMSGEIQAVGTQVIVLQPLLGIQIPNIVRFNDTDQRVRITELD